MGCFLKVTRAIILEVMKPSWLKCACNLEWLKDEAWKSIQPLELLSTSTITCNSVYCISRMNKWRLFSLISLKNKGPWGKGIAREHLNILQLINYWYWKTKNKKRILPMSNRIHRYRKKPCYRKIFFFWPIVNTIHKGTSTTNYTLNREILIVCRIYSRFRSPRVL